VKIPDTPTVHTYSRKHGANCGEYQNVFIEARTFLL